MKILFLSKFRPSFMYFYRDEKRERSKKNRQKQANGLCKIRAFFPGQNFSPAIKRHFPNKKEEKRGFLFFVVAAKKKPPRINRLTPFHPPLFFLRWKRTLLAFVIFYYFSVRENELKKAAASPSEQKREISFQPTFSPFFSRVNQLRLGYAHDWNADMPRFDEQ